MENLNDLDGKIVDGFMLPGQDGGRIQNTSEKENGITLIFGKSYHGDRDEHWIAEFNKHGKELRRTNVRFIESIEWLR